MSYEFQLFTSSNPHSLFSFLATVTTEGLILTIFLKFCMQSKHLHLKIGYNYFTLNRNARETLHIIVSQFERKCAIYNWSLNPAVLFHYFNNILWTEGPPFGSSSINVEEVGRVTSSPFSCYNYKPLFSPNF